MIGSLRGTVLQKTPGQVLLDVQGIGYEIAVTVSAFDRIPDIGRELLLYISESMAMYGGGTTLYGFLAPEDKEIYLLLKEIPGTGAKKSLEYLEKISRSAPDFRRAILEGDHSALVSLFGFTRKTADKMIVALKDRVAGLRVQGREKFSAALQGGDGLRDALAALLSLGYRESEARSALERLPAPLRSQAQAPDLVKEALKQLV